MTGQGNPPGEPGEVIARERECSPPSQDTLQGDHAAQAATSHGSAGAAVVGDRLVGGLVVGDEVGERVGEGVGEGVGEAVGEGVGEAVHVSFALSEGD